MYPMETWTEFVSLSVLRDGPPVALANPFDVKRSSAETEYFVYTSKTGMTLWHFISKMINLLWDAVAAVAAVVTHSASVPQTYPPRPQHTHSSPACIHSTTEPRLSTTLLSHCGLYLNVWPAFN